MQPTRHNQDERKKINLLSTGTDDTNRAGYKCKDVGVMNMFPHTVHVESIALFEK